MALESRVTELGKAIAAASPRAEVEALAMRTNEALETAAKARAELAGIAGGQAPSGSAGPGAASAPAGVSPAELQAITERLARAEASATQATQTLQAAMPRLAGLESATRSIGTPNAQVAGAVQLLLSERIRQAIDEGRPFVADLKALATAGVPEAALQPLAATSTKGAPTTRQMRDELRLKRRLMSEERAGQTVSFSDQALMILGRVVSVQKLDGAAATTPPALVARIDSALENSDSQAALGAWKALPEPARRLSENLGAYLTQRSDADTAIKTISDAALQALSAQTPASALPLTR